MKSGAMRSFILWRRDPSALRLRHPIGPPVRDEQEHGDHQERSNHEPELVPTALMCEDHPDDRTV